MPAKKKASGSKTAKRPAAPRRGAPRRGKKQVKGEGFMDFIKKAHSYVKDNKIISKGANVVGNIARQIPLPQAQMVGEYANKVEGVAKEYGYGRKRVMRKGKVCGYGNPYLI